MPKAKHRTIIKETVLPTEEREVEEPELTPSEVEAYGAIARIKEELGAEDGRVFLRRRDDKGRLAALGSLPAIDFSIDQVIQDYGGGRYEATFFKGQENLGSVVFVVDEAIPRKIPKALREKAEELGGDDDPRLRAGLSLGMVNPELVALREVMARQTDLLNQLIVQLATGKKDERGITMNDVLSLITAVSSRSEAAPSDKMADLIKTGIELGQLATGQGDSMLPIVEKLGVPAIQILQQALNRERAAGGAAVPPPRSGHPALPPQTEVPAVPPNSPAWMIQLAPFIPQILSWAKAGKDPALYAAVIVDNLPPGVEFELAQAVKDPEFVGKAVAALPMLKAYPAWTQAVLSEMKTILSDEEPKGDDFPEDGSGDV